MRDMVQCDKCGEWYSYKYGCRCEKEGVINIMEDVVIPATKCDNCRNETICKYSDEMANVQIAIENIKTSTKSPIMIDTECKSYERKSQKQDGVVYR